MHIARANDRFFMKNYIVPHKIRPQAEKFELDIEKNTHNKLVTLLRNFAKLYKISLSSEMI